MQTVLPMPEDLLRSTLSSIEDGSKVKVLFVHTRDLNNARTICGKIKLNDDGMTWSVHPTSTQRFRFPNQDTLVLSVEVLHRASSASAVREEDDSLEEVLEMTRQPARAQPPAIAPILKSTRQPTIEATQAQPSQVQDLLTAMLSQQQQFQQVMVQLLRPQQVQPTHQPLPPPTPTTNTIQDEVSRLLLFSDAIRGHDSPTWRLCPGLILPRFTAEKYLIFSIPHLLFTEVNGEMIRAEKGSATRRYHSILSIAKFSFPNQIQVRSQQNPKDKVIHDESNAGIRSQIERAERMFGGLLARIDQTDTIDFPTSKSEWMLFIDIGAEMLELYATLAFGFTKGGGKLSIAYSTSISQGKFDASKLWETVACFRT